MMFARDVVGNRLSRSQKSSTRTLASSQVQEVVFALPFSFDHEDYVQIITDMAERLGPALGWEPGASKG